MCVSGGQLGGSRTCKQYSGDTDCNDIIVIPCVYAKSPESFVACTFEQISTAVRLRFVQKR